LEDNKDFYEQTKIKSVNSDERKKIDDIENELKLKSEDIKKKEKNRWGVTKRTKKLFRR